MSEANIQAVPATVRVPKYPSQTLTLKCPQCDVWFTGTTDGRGVLKHFCWPKTHPKAFTSFVVEPEHLNAGG